LRAGRADRRIRSALLALGLCVVVCGCGNLGYYLRSAHGQSELSERARPIRDVLADPSTPPDLKARLEAVTKIREFASRDLGLPDGAGFRTYADLERPFVVWNVYAAPELSLKPREWCFPFAGCVTYRGYFSETEARAFADGLAAAGDDVYVGGVAAYSTLGWFDDPVLNTFVGYPEPDLARLIFHELAHRVAYAKDDTAFNESFATAVELEGARRWLSRSASDAELAGVREAERRRHDFRALVERCRARLAALYASDASNDEKRRGKAAIFDQLRSEYEAAKASWGGYAGYDAWFAQPLNNARVASVAAYTGLVPQFDALLARAGGDLPRFYAVVRRLAALPKRDRLVRLRDPEAALGEAGGEQRR
jgi:predicted aminopeptidase